METKMKNLPQDFILEYTGYGIHDSKCRVQFFDAAGECKGKIVCLMTELDDNPGTSITNAA